MIDEWDTSLPHESFSIRSEVLERLRVLLVAGIPVGLLVAGIGGRLAMLLLRVTSPSSVDGVTSDDGFEIGRVTLAGTYNLLAIGAAVGIIGAAAYRAVRPWLLGPNWFGRVTVAAGSGAVVGAMLIHADGIDFRVLEPLWLAIVLFVALPAAFAVAVGWSVDRVAAPGSWTRSGRRRWAVPMVLVAVFPFTLTVAITALVVLAVWVPVRRAIARYLGTPTIVRVVVRSLWLTAASVGLLALVSDVRDLG